MHMIVRTPVREGVDESVQATDRALPYREVPVGQEASSIADPNTDTFDQWNLGAEFTWQQFGIGGVYTRDNGGLHSNGENRTWVGGVDYATGPFKLGASYLDNREGLGQASATVTDGNLDSKRVAGGVIYTYGPGMTFRGSVGYVRSNDSIATTDATVHSTDVLLGTQINF